MKSFLLIPLLILSSTILAQEKTDFLKLKPNKIGWGIEIGPYPGEFYVTNESKNSINNGRFGTIGSLYLSYGRIMHHIRFVGTSSEIKNNIPNYSTWEKGNEADALLFEVMTSYKIIKTRRFNFGPYLGGYTARFKNYKEDVLINENDPTFNYSFGTSLEFKFGFSNKYIFRKEALDKETTHGFIKLYSGYYNGLFKQFDLNGGLIYWNLSIGINIRGSEVVAKD